MIKDSEAQTFGVAQVHKDTVRNFLVFIEVVFGDSKLMIWALATGCEFCGIFVRLLPASAL